MHGFTYEMSGILWVICYVAAIWICVIGKKRNPNKGWNFIIIAQVIYIIEYLPTFYYHFLLPKFPNIFWINNAQYVFFLMLFVLIPIGMILALIGLYFIAQGKKKKSKKTVKKRRG